MWYKIQSFTNNKWTSLGSISPVLGIRHHAFTFGWGIHLKTLILQQLQFYHFAQVSRIVIAVPRIVKFIFTNKSWVVLTFGVFQFLTGVWSQTVDTSTTLLQHWGWLGTSLTGISHNYIENVFNHWRQKLVIERTNICEFGERNLVSPFQKSVCSGCHSYF